mgnify:CR=1 FL=1
MNKLIALLLSSLAFNAMALVQKFDTAQQAAGLDEQYDQVVFIDHKLNRIELAKIFANTVISNERTIVKVTAERFGSKRTDTGTLRAWTVVKNRTDHDLQVEGRVIFFDQDLIPLGDTTAWKRMHIPANGIGTYRDSSLSFDASHYVIELREGR